MSIDGAELPPGRLPGTARAALVAAAGPGGLRDDRGARIRHAAGRGYPDLLRLRSGRVDPAPDAVATPADADAVAAVLEVCSGHGLAVVPFGGGTSVVGGVEPISGDHAGVLALSLAGLSGLRALDERSATATLAGGTPLPEAERELARRGFTLGHFPQSFEYATVGGCVATRSAGQASTGYGRIDELLRGVELVAPAGRLTLGARPASAAGPELRQLVAGSEGVLGVIVSADVEVCQRPLTRHYEGWALAGFREGADALRTLVQAGAAPEVARLSDEAETQTTLMLSGGGTGSAVLRGYLRLRRLADGCLLICGWEGDAADVGRRRHEGARLLRRFGAVALGTPPGQAWEAGRYAAPYLRDALLDDGVMVETLETASSWSGLERLYLRVRTALTDALAGRGTPPLVLCHISHLYRTGASLYFTFMARQQPGAELAQWQAAKSAASEAIVAAGATITHHHAVGRDHRPWLEAETGALGLQALAAVKQRWDPAGIMNPGKLGSQLTAPR